MHIIQYKYRNTEVGKWIYFIFKESYIFQIENLYIRLLELKHCHFFYFNFFIYVKKIFLIKFKVLPLV